MKPFFSAIALLFAAITASAHADEGAAIPAPLQAALFKKILLYDKTFEGKAGQKILVCHSGESDAAAELAKAFTEAGMPATSVKVAQALSALDEVAVVYALGPLPQPLREALEKKHVLVVSGSSMHVKDGSAAVGLDRRDDGRPLILVDVARARAEGHEFSAELLRLAKIVG
jgi:hypothetical protein